MSEVSRKTKGASRRLIDGFERLALVFVWAATIAVFGYLRPDSFLTWSNFATILGSQSVIVVTALGLIIPLTAVMVARYFGRFHGPDATP